MSEVIDVRAVQPLKAFVPMVIPVAMVMEVKVVAPENAEVPIAVTVSPPTAAATVRVDARVPV